MGGYLEMNRKRIIQILIPCLIVVGIIGIYFIKNKPSDNRTEISSNEDIVKNEEVVDDEFALEHTTMVDFEELTSHGLPVIVDYGSDSCIPCKQMAPVLEKLNEEMTEKAYIKFVDVWKYADAASNVPVQVIPTQVLFHADGTPFVPSEEISSQIEFIQYTSRETGEHIFTVHQGGLNEEQMRMILEELGVDE